MDYLTRTADIPLSHLQEKEDPGRLTNQLYAYLDQARHVDQQVNMDTSAFLRSREVLDDNIVNLKNIYESQLEDLRKENEVVAHERNSLQAKCSSQQKSVEDLQERLSVETGKNIKLLDEIHILQRSIEDLLSELQGTHNAVQQPQESLDLLQKHVNNLTREVDQWKHKCEHEQLATQEVEERLQQVLKKLKFYKEVHDQEIKYYQARLDIASATILNREAHAQKLNTTEVPVSELLKQEQDKSNTDLRNYKIESQELYAKDLSALKAKTDIDADKLQRSCHDKVKMTGSIEELQAKIKNFEEQVVSLQYHNKLLEDALFAERSQSDHKIQQINQKFRDMQDMLVTEVTSLHDSHSPVQAEIEAFKFLLEEEVRRLQVPLDIVSVLTSVSKVRTTDQILVPENALTNYMPAGNISRNQTLDDRNKTDASVGEATASQLLTSLPIVPATSVPTTSFMTTDDYSSSYPYTSGITGSMYSYEPLSPLNTFYIPQELRSTEEDTLASVADFNSGFTTSGPSLPEILLPMTGPQYNYKDSHGWIFPHTTPSPPLTKRILGPIHARSKSAPAKAHKTDTENQRVEESYSKENEMNLDRIDSEFTQENNVPEETFQDLKKDILITKPRPNSSPMDRLPLYNLNNPDSISGAIGDLKIVEVDKSGKFVKLLNDGSTEIELDRYSIQQFVGGRPVAVFRFPPQTSFVPDSTITVWSAMNDPSVHNPPTDFFCNQIQKWKTGSNYTTILCQANGEAMAWIKAAHRFTKDAFVEAARVQKDIKETDEINQEAQDEAKDEEILTELKLGFSRSNSEPVYLRRKKRQPHSIAVSKHPYASNPAAIIHPHTGQPRPLSFGNDNSTYSRQSRTQTIRPDPIPGLPYTCAPAQRLSSKSSRTKGSGQGTHSSASTENATTIGETCEGPSPFMSQRNKLATGLKQVCSQHHPDFLPPMPQTLLTSW